MRVTKKLRQALHRRKPKTQKIFIFAAGAPVVQTKTPKIVLRFFLFCSSLRQALHTPQPLTKDSAHARAHLALHYSWTPWSACRTCRNPKIASEVAI